jgi:hypothetical protein
VKSKTAPTSRFRPGVTDDADRFSRSRKPVDAHAEPENIGRLSRRTNKAATPEETHQVTLTTSLSQFVAGLSPNRLPEEAVRIARMGFIDSIGTGAAPHDQVIVQFAEGRTIAGEPVSRVRGSPSRPLTDQQLHDKFADCLDAGDSAIPADVLFERLAALRSINARDLTARL